MKAFEEGAMGFARVLVPLIFRHRGSVISWIRSREHNKDVDGVSNSLHMGGLAADLVFDTEEDKADFAGDAQQAGLQVVVKPGSVHVEADYKDVLEFWP